MPYPLPPEPWLERQRAPWSSPARSPLPRPPAAAAHTAIPPSSTRAGSARLPPSGRCPTCAQRIGSPALTAELSAAAAFAALAVGGATSWFAAAQYWLAACGIALALIDLAVQRLPNVLTAPAGAGTILLLTGAALAGEPGSLGRAAAGAGAVTAVFLLLALTAGMGLGDVKLAPAIGALLGWHSWTSLWWGTIASFLIGGVCGAVLLATGRHRRAQVAFGPFVIIGALAVSATAS
ncbi:prepilin peptidase [Streptomyces sp. NPDC053048]|uniref:prepilin peptidase n=1 Tax=Streptomyces sp. NPDC053048 TaxID=3365694 RepID=UPI0037D37F92